MSKKGKRIRALKRKEEKRKAKQAKKLLYLQYAKEGKQKGSYRSRKKNTWAINLGPHTFFCGNVGCDRCFETTEKERKRIRT